MRKLPENLKNKQEKTKIETLKKIDKAMNELNNEGYEITIKLLVERTGLSRSLFSKDHVKEFLKSKEISSKKNSETILEEFNFRTNYFKLEEENKKLKLKLENKQDELIKKNNIINDLKVKVYEKEDEICILRGRIHNVDQHIKLLGLQDKFSNIYYVKDKI